VLSGEATNAIFIVLGLIRPWLNHSIYRTQELAKDYSTNVVSMYSIISRYYKSLRYFIWYISTT